jgi:hypothetical protein
MRIYYFLLFFLITIAITMYLSRLTEVGRISRITKIWLRDEVGVESPTSFTNSYKKLDGKSGQK